MMTNKGLCRGCRRTALYAMAAALCNDCCWSFSVFVDAVAVVFPFPEAIDGGGEVEAVEENGGDVKAALAIEVDGDEVDEEPVAPHLDDLLCQHPGAYDVERGGERVECGHGRVCKVLQGGEQCQPDSRGDNHNEAELAQAEVAVDDRLLGGGLSCGYGGHELAILSPFPEAVGAHDDVEEREAHVAVDLCVAIDAGVDGRARGTDNPHDGLLMKFKPEVEKTGEEADVL